MSIWLPSKASAFSGIGIKEVKMRKVYRFFTEKANEGLEELVYYSNKCVWQDKNRIRIGHRFVELGHTQNENDSFHALMERKNTSTRSVHSITELTEITEISWNLRKCMK